ncbi:universal stress protein [Natribacillus halophilus]|uniref:Nucleotide-binding universal stress protein, UspA family n=1 Tax=Natribacillus halophilus TaxID=549003 RepID=A0A1G8PE18_9BACI|nr:universal stress protein [Natribacillus halophilus]SDI89980.1 Nucleotide-binding universal stress protein, UspA family [Natribacillus halophilus]
MADYKNILVCVYGEESSSEDTFDQACAFALKEGAKLYITSVVDPKPYASMSRFDKNIVERVKQQASEQLQAFKQKAEEKGIAEVETILDVGTPKVRIASHIVPNYNIDLIIAGETVGRRVERAITGSISKGIAKRATCDVIIVNDSGEPVTKT